MGEICLSMLLSHFRMGEIFPTINMVILSFGEICPYMNQDFLKWEKYVPLYIKAGSPKKKKCVPVLIKPIF